ncbi:hypothetical protein NFI96_007558 [Prochilodus magdalenae]|nr:hypothetical protein NFI96_007558 [Prochilodus magdalenae]
MLPTLWGQFGDGPFLFQHDRTPVHRASSIKTWMRESGVEELDWPAQSPDLHPIEHLRDGLERRLRARPSRPTSGSDLTDVLLEEWSGIPINTFLHLAVILPDGAPDKLGVGDEVGSEEDLYEDLRSSGHRFGHPGGAGEQLAINETRSVCKWAKYRLPVDSGASAGASPSDAERSSPSGPPDVPAGRGGDEGRGEERKKQAKPEVKLVVPVVLLLLHGGAHMARSSLRSSRGQRVGLLDKLLRCNMDPDTQRVVVFLIMMFLIIINVVLVFLLAFQ